MIEKNNIPSKIDCTSLTEAQKTKDPSISTAFTVGLKRKIYQQEQEIDLLKQVNNAFLDKINQLETTLDLLLKKLGV